MGTDNFDIDLLQRRHLAGVSSPVDTEGPSVLKVFVWNDWLGNLVVVGAVIDVIEHLDLRLFISNVVEFYFYVVA